MNGLRMCWIGREIGAIWEDEWRDDRMMDKASELTGCESLGSSSTPMSLILNWFSESCLLSEVPGKCHAKHYHTLSTSDMTVSLFKEVKTFRSYKITVITGAHLILTGSFLLHRYTVFPLPSLFVFVSSFFVVVSFTFSLFRSATRLCM